MSEILASQLDIDPYGEFKRLSAIGPEYAAGFPGYTENFSRDAFTSGIVGGSSDLLSAQLELSAHYQGTKNDLISGEQIGRIHHQMPGVQLEGREGYTTYNACDTTPLFLIGAEGLYHANPQEFARFLDKRQTSLELAVDHIIMLTGMDDNLYREKPPAGGKCFGLKVTYWKDSILPHADGKQEPIYPVAFALTQFIAARSLLSASRLLQRPDLERKADAMFCAGIQKFMQNENFVVYEDVEGVLYQASSDELHALAYIPSEYTELLPVEALKRRAELLATPYGFMCTPMTVASQLEDKYHGDVVWIIDQALIHYGATKFKIDTVANTAANVAEHIGEGQELLGIENHGDGIGPIPKGFPRMLWSKAAAEYFTGRSSLTQSMWL